MKIRSGFVSNSSSSSFVIIGNDSLIIPSFNGDILQVPQDLGGETEFGWGPETITDIGSRINFAYLQTEYVKPDDVLLQKAMEATGESHPWLSMLEDVLKKNLGVDKIEWNISEGYTESFSGYIDHQSASSEGINTEIFNSIDELERFIFAGDSRIELDNDNH